MWRNERHVMRMFMNNQLPEEKLNKLLPALSPLAKCIGTGTILEEDVLEGVLHGVGVEIEGWALKEIEIWSKILQQARTVSDDDEKTAIAVELQSRGIPEASATLAVYTICNPRPLLVEPQSINFGCLKPDNGANATLKVSGQLLKATVRNSQLKVTLLNRGSGNSLVKVQLLAGSAGESLQDNILLEGERGKIRVFVTAQWEKEPPMLQYCPRCGKKALFWNRYDKKFECLNLDCKVEGSSLDKLAKPQGRYRLR